MDGITHLLFCDYVCDVDDVKARVASRISAFVLPKSANFPIDLRNYHLKRHKDVHAPKHAPH